MGRRGLVALMGLVVYGATTGGIAYAAQTGRSGVLFDELHPATGVRVKAIVSNFREEEASEFNLRIQLWDENDALEPSAAPTLHLIAPDDSVSLRKLWFMKTYDEEEGEATVADLGNWMGDAPPQLPEMATRNLRQLRDDGVKFANLGPPSDSADGEESTAVKHSLQRALLRENAFDTYTIPGPIFDVGTAMGYEYVIPLRVEGRRFSARIVAHGFRWRVVGKDETLTEDVPIAIDIRFPLRSGRRAASTEPGPSGIAHPGVIVRINADDPQRKPYLRVDVVLHYAPGARGCRHKARAASRQRGQIGHHEGSDARSAQLGEDRS